MPAYLYPPAIFRESELKSDFFAAFCLPPTSSLSSGRKKSFVYLDPLAQTPVADKHGPTAADLPSSILARNRRYNNMPSRWIPSGFSTPSAPSSRPSSRASSPTRNGPAPRPANMLSSRRRDGTVDSGELNDYFSVQPSPAYDASAPTSPSTWGGPATASALSTPGGSSGHTLEIVLDSDQLVLRGQGGDMNPAYLSGRVELNLLEATNIKEIMMSLTAKAKVQFSDGSGYVTKRDTSSFKAADDRNTERLQNIVITATLLLHTTGLSFKATVAILTHSKQVVTRFISLILSRAIFLQPFERTPVMPLLFTNYEQS